MEKYFCNYNQSLALKELGFDEPCLGKYDTKQGDKWFLNIYSEHLQTQFSNKNKACIAPLKSQVFEWFRIKYKYYFWIEPCSQHKVFHFNITGSPSSFTYCTIDETKPNAGGFKSYEEAESACIDKLIEIVKGQ